MTPMTPKEKADVRKITSTSLYGTFGIPPMGKEIWKTRTAKKFDFASFCKEYFKHHSRRGSK